MKLQIVLTTCAYLCSFTNATAMTASHFTADNVYTGKTPTKITFGFTPTTTLVAGDVITMLVSFADNSGLFTIQNTAFPVTVISGAPNCAATAKTTTTKHLLVTLADSGDNRVCPGHMFL